MYRISTIHQAQGFIYTLASDGEGIVAIYITDHEAGSLRYFKPATQQLLLARYIEGIRDGMADGSDELFEYVTDGLSVSGTSKYHKYLGVVRKIFTNRVVLFQGKTMATNIICDEKNGLTAMRLGNVSLGEVAYENEKTGEKPPTETEVTKEKVTEKVVTEKKESEEETKQEGKETAVRQNKGETAAGQEVEIKDERGGHQGRDDKQAWWKISKPIPVSLMILLAVAVFFVTLLLTGKISFGSSGQPTEKEVSAQSQKKDDTPQEEKKRTPRQGEQKEESGEQLSPQGGTSDFHEGLALVKDENGLYGYMDKTGKVVIAHRWLEAHDFSQGMALVKDNSGLWGYINNSGRQVIPCKWVSASDFDDNGIATVVNKYNERFRIDKNGVIQRNVNNPRMIQR